jgi:hypothetical protein
MCFFYVLPEKRKQGGGRRGNRDGVDVGGGRARGVSILIIEVYLRVYIRTLHREYKIVCLINRIYIEQSRVKSRASRRRRKFREHIFVQFPSFRRGDIHWYTVKNVRLISRC